MYVWRSLVAGIACFVLVAAVGCGSGNFATVTGIVTHKGTPVDGAKVEFHGTTQEEGRSDIFATQTDSSGKYYIAGTGERLGIAPGMYKIVITKLEGNMAANAPADGMDAGQLEAQMSDMGPGTGGASSIKNHLPAEYASPATTKLSATVEPGKNENVNFDIP
jgi:hypothetical protein